MKKLKGIIFDVDGTLTDNEKNGHRVAFNLAFESVGLDWFWDTEKYGQLLKVPGGKERLKYYIENEKSKSIKKQGLSNLVDNLHSKKTQFYSQIIHKGKISLRTGVKRLLSEIHEAGIPMALATTSTHKSVRSLLKHSLLPGSENWFKIIASAETKVAKKPAPDIYELVLNKLSFSAENCIAIEDSSLGLQSSFSAGLKTIITVNEYTAHEDFSKAVLVLDHMGEKEKPCHIIQGKDVNKSYLDLKWLQLLLQE